MGDRYEISVKCECGHTDEAWYAPTCGSLTWTCPKCNKDIDLEKYTGISAVGCANTSVGVKAVEEQLREIRTR